MLRRIWGAALLRRILRACSVEKNVSNCNLGRVLRGCHVRILRAFVLRSILGA